MWGEPIDDNIELTDTEQGGTNLNIKSGFEPGTLRNSTERSTVSHRPSTEK